MCVESYPQDSTALYLAVLNHQFATGKLLVEAGAQTTLPNGVSYISEATKTRLGIH